MLHHMIVSAIELKMLRFIKVTKKNHRLLRLVDITCFFLGLCSFSHCFPWFLSNIHMCSKIGFKRCDVEVRKMNGEYQYSYVNRSSAPFKIKYKTKQNKTKTKNKNFTCRFLFRVHVRFESPKDYKQRQSQINATWNQNQFETNEEIRSMHRVQTICIGFHEVECQKKTSNTFVF